ncbi:tyrosine-type recombinase/integrase [Profundibacter sp.]
MPGLLDEKGRGWRVRVKGNKRKRIPIPVGPDHPDFWDFYNAARAGVPLGRKATALEVATPKSISWITRKFEKAMQDKVDAGLMHPSTLQQRGAFYARLRKEYGNKHMEMPRSELVKFRDGMASTPGAADNMVKSVRALFTWAVEVGIMQDNPATGIGKINKGKGAVPWSIDDLKVFRKRHQVGTTAHLALTLLMFTACRVSDVVLLGHRTEVKRDGLSYLDWQPAKSGSARVTVPILPPLARAIEAQTVVGPRYLLTAHGKPFSTPASFGNWFRARVAEAGLKNRSPHGIRKAAGELMALEGATQYHIMAVHGHTQAKTSEIYTQGVNRQKLAEEAMRLMGNMDW